MNTTLSNQERELRAELREDLLQHLDRDVHRAGYIVAYVALRLPLAELEALVDEMDKVYPVPQPEPVQHDEKGWPILRASDPAGTAWERHDDPEANR